MPQDKREDKKCSVEMLRNYRKKLEMVGGIERLKEQPESIIMLDEYLDLAAPFANCGVMLDEDTIPAE